MGSEASISVFQADHSERLFAERLGGASDERKAATLCKFVEHLHAFIRETRPSLDDWRETLEFLTKIGHLCDERRQEWVLVSDLLGTSSLVDALNSCRPARATPNTMRGPFYRSDVPLMRPGTNICLNGIGTPVAVSLLVSDVDGYPISDARVETWQADEQGYFENQQPDLLPEYNLRGHFLADEDGLVTYRTIRPSGYEVPKDGPLAELLLRLGVPLRRPAHFSFQVTAEGYETLTTQIFDGEDPNLDRDPLFSVKSGLIGTFEDPDDGSDTALTLNVEFRLNRNS